MAVWSFERRTLSDMAVSTPMTAVSVGLFRVS
jgi:hypothetical protein